MDWRFKKLCKGDMSFEDEEHSGQPSEVDNHGERSLKLIPLQLHEKLPKNSVSAILWSFGIWSKLERWKSSLSGWLMNWLQIKKIVLLKCHLFLFYTTTTNHFLIGLWHAKKSGFYDNQRRPAQWSDREEAPKHLPKPDLHQKKVHGHYLMVCCLSDPLQLSESCRHHYTWEVCSANQWDAWKTATPTTGICQQNGPSSSPQQHPTACHTSNTSKVEQIGPQSFASSATFTCPLTNQLPLLHVLDKFLQGKSFYNQKEEIAFQEFIESQGTDVYATGTNLFLVGKIVLIVMVPILINKDVFEPSYNDSKFTVQNCSYTCTNLIVPYKILMFCS